MGELRAAKQIEVDQTLLFKPQLPEDPKPDVESKLKLLKEPNSYLDRVAQQRSQKELKAKQALCEKEKLELAECSFSPQVKKGAPSFVSEMAETYKLARSLDPEKLQPTQPEWR